MVCNYTGHFFASIIYLSVFASFGTNIYSMIKKKISFSTYGQQTSVGDIAIARLLPNRYADAVGPFIFLDHIIPILHDADETRKTAGTGAHPHRGIATLTYILQGEAEHFDSAGNHKIVKSGGIQWMNAGNGIVHDEVINVDSATKDFLTHGFQFWINLPAAIKAKSPSYMAIQANEVPIKMLPENAGWVKIIVGSFEEFSSVVPNFSEQFLYHLHLHAGQNFALETIDNLEYACFLPALEAHINDEIVRSGEFLEFDRTAGCIEIYNHTNLSIDLLIFGGERYKEAIVAEGPFVMNSQAEIATAYRDFMAGKYGEINYDKNI